MNSESTPQSGKYVILFAGFFGWLLAGVQLGVTSLLRPAISDLLSGTSESPDVWFGYLTATFLFGGAAGGYLFGSLGDLIGRKKAMALAMGIPLEC